MKMRNIKKTCNTHNVEFKKNNDGLNILQCLSTCQSNFKSCLSLIEDMQREISDTMGSIGKEHTDILIFEEMLDYLADFQISLEDLEQKNTKLIGMANNISEHNISKKSNIGGHNFIYLSSVHPIVFRPISHSICTYRCWYKNPSGGFRTALISSSSHARYPCLKKYNIKVSLRYMTNVLIDLGIPNNKNSRSIKILEIPMSAYDAMRGISKSLLGSDRAMYDKDGLKFKIRKEGQSMKTKYIVQELGKDTLSKEEETIKNSGLFDLRKYCDRIDTDDKLKKALGI